MRIRLTVFALLAAFAICAQANTEDCHDGEVRDSCGVCNGNDATADRHGNCCDASARDCDGVCHGPNPPDACKVCGGDNSTCCGDEGACSGHGACDREHSGCVCDENWTGRFCQRAYVPCDTDPCEHGRCDATGHSAHCICEEGWHGATCSMRICPAHAYYHFGNDACRCNPPYTGDACDTCTSPPEGYARVCLITDTGNVPLALPLQNAAIAVENGLFGHAVGIAGEDGLDCACAPTGEAKTRDAPPYGEVFEHAVTRALSTAEGNMWPGAVAVLISVPVLSFCLTAGAAAAFFTFSKVDGKSKRS